MVADVSCFVGTVLKSTPVYVCSVTVPSDISAINYEQYKVMIVVVAVTVSTINNACII